MNRGPQSRLRPPLDPSAAARLRAAWLDPDVTLESLVRRFALTSRDAAALRRELGPKPRAGGWTTRQGGRAWKKRA